MAGKNNIYKLNDFIEGNIKLNKSNLNRFYKSYFETPCYNYVESYFYCSQDTNLDTLPSHLLELYRKFERNLKLIWADGETVYDIWETDKEKLCSYLKYWIYDQLISENVSQVDFSQFFKLWKERKSEKCPKCECEFNINSFYEVNQLKRIYDYSLFLRAYKKTSKINNQISNMSYCNYISDAKAMYELLGHTCEKNTTEYCKELNKYVLPYIKYVDSGKYKVVEENEDTEREEDTEGDEDTKKEEDLSGISCNADLKYDPNPEELQEAEEILKKLAERKEKEQREYDQLEGAEDAVLSIPLGNRGSDHVLPDTFPGRDAFMLSPGSGTGSEGNGSPTKTIASASLVGVPSIIFLLYKFSPIRTWLDPRIRKTKSDLRNSIQGSNELQSHDYNFDTTNMDFNRFNVGYQSR
ncbi:PIR protein [Plasmodium vivax]|uniref:VIR protein n=1 Tax=Plasmodium vivax TaxID=5855 RepID=A0A564ZRI1_PLAVI|nr:PIR protein [Plasmodium vivax]